MASSSTAKPPAVTRSGSVQALIGIRRFPTAAGYRCDRERTPGLDSRHAGSGPGTARGV